MGIKSFFRHVGHFFHKVGKGVVHAGKWTGRHIALAAKGVSHFVDHRIIKPVAHAVTTVATTAKGAVTTIHDDIKGVVTKGGNIISGTVKDVRGIATSLAGLPKMVLIGAVALIGLVVFRAESVGRGVSTAAGGIAQLR